MITVKKNAIKYKSSDGTMKDSGVLCQVGIVVPDPNAVQTFVMPREVVDFTEYIEEQGTEMKVN